MSQEGGSVFIQAPALPAAILGFIHVAVCLNPLDIDLVASDSLLPMVCSLPETHAWDTPGMGILEWVTVPTPPGGVFPTQDQTHIS